MMFAKRVHLFSVFGLDVAIDPSWFLVAILITWSLASGLFPAWYPHLSTVAYSGMGAAERLVCSRRSCSTSWPTPSSPASMA